MENPFTLKVGQIFTGFGVGCGVGIGVGRPLYLGAIPALQQVMSATRGATDAFSGVGRYANNSLRRFGLKNIEVGIGCGVGFGHGFGVGLAIKPGVVNQIQSFVGQTAMKMMSKMGIAPGLLSQSIIPGSMQSSMSVIPQMPRANIQTTASSAMQMESTTSNTMEDGSRREVLGSHSETFISNFLQNPVVKDEEMEINELAGQLRSENNIFQVLLKHQKIIEELMEENEKLRQVLMEDLNVSPSKLQTTNRKLGSQNPCSDCFQCRRRRRKSSW